MKEKKDHRTENTMNSTPKRTWITPEIVEEDYSETEAATSAWSPQFDGSLYS